MIRWFERNARLRRTGRQLYESIVAQARAEVFYRDLGVADTIEGRFEMIVLHMTLVLQRLGREAEVGQRLGQAVIEHLIADMDDALRQIGIGDMGVPRRVQRAVAALKERSGDYAAGLKTDQIERALLRHVYGHSEGTAPAAALSHAAKLADYIRKSTDLLETMPSDVFLAGHSLFAAIAPDRN